MKDLDQLERSIEHLPNDDEFVGWYELGAARRQKVLQLVRVAKAAQPFAHCLKPRCKFCGGNSHHWNSEPYDQKLCFCETEHPSRVNTISYGRWFSAPCGCCDGCTLVTVLETDGEEAATAH